MSGERGSFVAAGCWSAVFFFSSRRRHTRLQGDWSSDVCSSDLLSCAGRWSRERGAGSSKAAIVRLGDAASASGGLVEADVVPGACGGALRLKWPEGYRRSEERRVGKEGRSRWSPYH